MVGSRLLALLIILGAAFLAGAAAPDAAVPAGAHASYGNTWECDRGYLKGGLGCTQVQVPANAHLTGDSYFPGWTCNRGFREQSGNCLRIEVPPHAYASDFTVGRGWDCDRGYTRLDGLCAPVVVPENGYLNRCERNYFKEGYACVGMPASRQ